jgi:hypothetical protein
MVSKSLSGIFVIWDNGVAHGPNVYIFHAILALPMETDLMHLSPNNLEGLGTRLDDGPLNDMYYTICAHA